MGYHSLLSGANLHNSKIIHNDGNPNGVVNATVIGEMCIDTTNQVLYTATATGTGSWVSIGGIGGVPNLQDLTDVDKTNIANQTILEYNSVTGKHEYVEAAPLYNTIYVSKSGNDTTATGRIDRPFLTINAALTSIVGSAADNSFDINIQPGFYQEDNPLTVPSYVTLFGAGGLTVNRIYTLNAGQPLFVMEPFSALEGLSMMADVTAPTTVDYSGSGPIILNRNLFIEYSGLRVNNINAAALVYNTTAITYAGTMSSIFNVLAGKLIARQTTVYEQSTLANLVIADGANASIHLIDLHSYSINVTNGFYAKNSGTIHGYDCEINGATYSLRVINSGKIYGSAYYIDDYPNTIYDVYQETADGIVQIEAGELYINKLYVLNWDNLINIVYNSNFDGTTSRIISQDLRVGQAEQGRIFSVGGGSDTIRGMMVYTYNNTSYVDVTTAASATDGTTFTMPNVVNGCLYFSWDLKDSTSGDYLKFYGIQATVTSILSAGTGTYAWEYWNGTAWIYLPNMVNSGASPFYTRANKSFTIAEEENIRFSDVALQNWVKNDPISSGINRYWMRFRIITAITTAPTFDKISLHPSHFKVNIDGWVEYYGQSRPVSQLPWNLGLTSKGADATNSSTLFLSDTLDVGFLQNRFPDGNTTSRIGFVSSLPYEMDTSNPIRLRLIYRGDTTQTANVVLNIRTGRSTVGSSVYDSLINSPTTATTQKNYQSIIPMTTANLQGSISVDLSIDDFSSRRLDGTVDLIWVTVERAAGDTNDTYSGNFDLIAISPYFVKWCDGGHVL